MTLIRILMAAGGMTLAVLIVWAISAGDFSAAGSWLISDPWGIVTLTDLYLGFFMLTVLIWMLEPSKLIALGFIMPMPFLGNVWAVIWLIWRIGMLAGNARARADT